MINPNWYRNERNNLLVVGSGCGKTCVITERVAFHHLINAIPQKRILTLAFKTSAAVNGKKKENLKYRYEIS